MSAPLGTRRKRMVLCFVTEPDAPSRWCKVIGHNWAYRWTRNGIRDESEYKFCARCGADESWYAINTREALLALDEAAASEVPGVRADKT